MAFEYGIRQDQMMAPWNRFIIAVGSFSMDGVFENIFSFVGKHTSNKILKRKNKELWRK